MMNVIGIGIDLVDMTELEHSLTSQAFKRQVFTATEITYCEAKRAPLLSYAGKFAVKEAVMKTLGAGIYHGVWFAQIEVLNDEMGKPYLQLHRQALERAQVALITTWHISITHTKHTAAAVVLALA
jgi:holo-[acyl-carrier protein] synthase